MKDVVEVLRNYFFLSLLIGSGALLAWGYYFPNISVFVFFLLNDSKVGRLRKIVTEQQLREMIGLGY